MSQMNRLVYFHGLLSNPDNPKVHWLKASYEAWAPAIHYEEPAIMHTLLEGARNFRPHGLIGSSMGGYTAYWIGKALGVDVLLFNPALPYRSQEPDGQGVPRHPETPIRSRWVIGEQDPIIDPQANQALARKEPGSTLDVIPGLGHRIPEELFKAQVRQFVAETQADHDSA